MIEPGLDVVSGQGSRRLFKIDDCIQITGAFRLVRHVSQQFRHRFDTNIPFFFLELFPDALVKIVEHAYDDGPLHIGHGQTISQPYIVAWMSELLEAEPDMKVLEVGTGCGYQTAVLGKLAQHVFSIERIEGLSRQAAINLRRAGIENVTLRVGDGYEGWREYAPFPRILVAAAPSEIPVALTNQLAPNGVLVTPVGPRSNQTMIRIRKHKDGALERESLGAVSFVPLLPGEERESA